jgi:KipI family sensor histidine kinase inhibitor
MLGFLPGFRYWGGMDPRIECPRLESPRTSIPAGAVGIGGKQTGIYPISSPGGWRLIGRTPVKVYETCREEPILYRAGDYIRFYPISSDEFRKMEEEGFLPECKEENV